MYPRSRPRLSTGNAWGPAKSPGMKSKQCPCPSVYTYRKLGVPHFTMNLENPCDWSESTIAAILKNEVYPDNTINMRYSTNS